MLESLEPRRFFSISTNDIASSGNVGEFTSIAINPVTKRPAVAYYDVTHHDLKFAAFNGKQWVASTVDSPGNVGQYASLAFDSTGQAWIAYLDATHHTLKVANGNRTTWHTLTIADETVGDPGISLAIAKATQLPVISFGGTVDNLEGLQLATDTSAGWQLRSVDPTGDLTQGGGGNYSSLKLDSHDRPRISYSNSANANYASYDGHHWDLEIVATFALSETGYGTQLVLDATGNPHISYGDYLQTGGGGGIYYASRSGTVWSSPKIDLKLGGEAFDQATATSVVLNKAGEPIVAYVSSGLGNLDVAMQSNSSFSDTAVDSSGDVGGYLSMTTDSSGDTLIAYYNSVKGDLMLAKIS